MIKNKYSKIFILITIPYFSYGENITNFLYDKAQTFLDKILDIVPPIKNDKDKKNVIKKNNINNEEEGEEEEEKKGEEIFEENEQKSAKDCAQLKEYAQLIERHYIWVAFMGTLLKYCEINTSLNGPLFLNNEQNIKLEESIKTFFEEPLQNGTTIEKLSEYFNIYSLNDNFIAKEKTFIKIIEEISANLKSKEENNPNLFNIILILQNKNILQNNKKNIALSWMFTIAIGKYVAKKLSQEAEQCLDNNLYGENYIKTKTLEYIKTSFKERAILYQNLENMFLLFYKLADKKINDIFINQVCENMKNNLKDKCFRKSFTNLMYRNLDRERSYINLTEIMML